MATRLARQAAINDMFAIVEQRYGSMAALTENVGIERGPLTTESLRRLFSHETACLVVSGFVKSPEALGSRLAGLESVRNWSVSSSRGLESSDVGTVGLPFNMATGDEYHASVETATATLRDLCGGPTPLDQLRASLDDLWGASVRRHQGRPMHAGLARVMRGPTRWRDGFVHVDELAPLKVMHGVFSANIYLTMPQDGGGLEIWPVGFRSRWDFYRNALTLSALTVQDADAQARLRRKLPAPLTLTPQAGDLVLLSVQRPHAVTGFDAGVRVSLQSFLTVEPKSLLLEN